MCLQEHKRTCEHVAGARMRYSKYAVDQPINNSIAHVFSEHAVLASWSPGQSPAAIGLACRVVKELGAQHSAQAASAVLEWFRAQHGAAAPPTLYDACISVCAINFAPEEALRLFSVLEADGKRASPRLMNMLVTACCVGGFVDVAIEVRIYLHALVQLCAFDAVHEVQSQTSGLCASQCK
jgi:hypothetical protein